MLYHETSESSPMEVYETQAGTGAVNLTWTATDIGEPPIAERLLKIRKPPEPIQAQAPCNPSKRGHWYLLRSYSYRQRSLA